MFGRASKTSDSRGIPSQRRAVRRQRRSVTRRLKVESLESRMMLNGDSGWISGPVLTVSLAPDGTEVAGQVSDLFSELGALDQDRWQDAVRQAFQTWAKYISTDVSLVNDSGDPFGIAGPTQGDPRFGDVRIAAVPLANDVIAISVPHDELISGTWAGDVLLNSNAHFSTVSELYSIMLHEAGHVLGLGHSDNPASPMYFHGISSATIPTAQDIADLHSVYGTPAGDDQEDVESPVESTHDDDALDSAEHTGASREEASDESELRVGAEDYRGASGAEQRSEYVATRLTSGVQNLYSQSIATRRYTGSGTISSIRDIDTYRLVATERDGDGSRFLTITVRSEQAGGLIPRVEVYSQFGRRLNMRVLADANGTLVVQVADVAPQQNYLVRVAAADTIGRRRLGAYEIDAQFVDHQAELESFQVETLNASSPHTGTMLHVSETTLAHFILTADAVDTDTSLAVSSVIYDAAGKVVGRMVARYGQLQSSGTLLLMPGNYRVETTAVRLDGRLLSDVGFHLQGKTISLPIGPGISDPIDVPMLPQPNPDATLGTTLPPGLAVTDPIILPGPIMVPNPTPPIMVIPPQSDPGWLFGQAPVIAGTFGLISP